MTSTLRFFLFRMCCVFALLNLTAVAMANEWQQVSVPMVGVEHYAREVCLPFQAGDTVQYRFTSKHKINFNIHFHPESGTEFKSRLDAVQDVDDAFGSDAAQSYCFTWNNKTDLEGEEWDISLHYLVVSQ